MLTIRQNQIIEKAIKIIASKGVQGFTIKNLSKEIGISEPAIYRHFESKTDILLSMLVQFHHFTQDTAERILNSPLNSHERIQQFFRELLLRFSANPSLVSVIFAEEIFKSEKILEEKVIEIMNINENLIHQIILDAQLNNEVCKDFDANYYVLIIMGSFRLLVKKWEMNSYNFDLNKEGENLFLVLENSIKVK